jgi:three-Cys-motif partner protein
VSASRLQFDQIGYWSQVKLEIVRDYARAYSRILAKQPRFRHVYVDAFAGAGLHELKTSGELVPGSPLNALAVEPPFSELHLVDLDRGKTDHLRRLVGSRSGVTIYEGDCNKILVEKIFPRIRYEDYMRGLCLLDPYGLTLNWEVIASAAAMKSIEIFLNFPIMDMNRNALWSRAANVDPEDVKRMNAFWGDESWRNVVYKGRQLTLDGKEDLIKTAGNDQIAEAFRERLKAVAGFAEVPPPIPMRNSKNAIVYYLFFASHNKIGAKIARDVLKRYAQHRGS